MSKGFSMKQSQPAAIAWVRSRFMTLAVTASTGVRAISGVRRIACTTSMPLMPGRSRSRRTTSGRRSRTISRPLIPSFAPST